MPAHSKAMPDSPAVAGFAFYVSWLLTTASRRPDFHCLDLCESGRRASADETNGSVDFLQRVLC
jgi:hypothetical protein